MDGQRQAVVDQWQATLPGLRRRLGKARFRAAPRSQSASRPRAVHTVSFSLFVSRSHAHFSPSFRFATKLPTNHRPVFLRTRSLYLSEDVSVPRVIRAVSEASRGVRTRCALAEPRGCGGASQGFSTPPRGLLAPLGDAPLDRR